MARYRYDMARYRYRYRYDMARYRYRYRYDMARLGISGQVRYGQVRYIWPG